MTINIAEFFAENVYNPDYTDEITEDGEHIVEVVREAADELLRVHATTGIDLTQWEQVLALVRLVYPYVVVEGTEVTIPHTVFSREGETGRYWLDGDTTKPCNADAWAVSAEYSKYGRTELGWTR